MHNALSELSLEERQKLPPTRFAIFVVHNKLGPKRAELPVISSPAQEKFEGGVSTVVYYYAAETMPPVWIEFPWEVVDITEHNRLAAIARANGLDKPHA